MLLVGPFLPGDPNGHTGQMDGLCNAVKNIIREPRNGKMFILKPKHSGKLTHKRCFFLVVSTCTNLISGMQILIYGHNL